MATTQTTQVVFEVLTASAGTSGVQATQIVFEVLTFSGAYLAAASLAASLVWIYSGVSNQNTVVIVKGTAVSAEWVISEGTSHLYTWTFGGVTNYAGFVSTATTSSITRTFSIAPATTGMRQISSTLSATVNAVNSSITSATAVNVTAVTIPNLFDGRISKESQRARRVFPI